MEFAQFIQRFQPYMHQATWLLPAVAGYMAGRSAWGARRSSPFIRRCVAGLSLAILLAMPLYADHALGVWATILTVGLAFAAVGLTNQAMVVVKSRVGRLTRGMYRLLGSLGATAAVLALLGIASGNALVFSLGPSMWPAAAIKPSLEWLDTRAYVNAPPLPGQDVEFTVGWKEGAAARAGADTWPSGRYRKRVWAMEGDTVEFQDDRMLVNGHPVLDCTNTRQTEWKRDGRVWRTPQGAWWCFPDLDGDGVVDGDRPIVWASINRLVHAGKTFVLGPGELFVMGDNTIQSSDSREMGPIKVQWVDGRHHDAAIPQGKTTNGY